ncbi:MAG: hypothetical protein AMJ91_01670 [candidate division Zixibacteria bacterium SM23_73_3]|nr:MAG: hypothetical protein AMJ91_01670 [candidate division Zixibacteria bacterium SM23_73_3]
MKHSVSICILLLLVICIWSFGPIAQEAQALIGIDLTLPADSAKVTNPTPTFKWKVTIPPKEKPSRFHIMLATDPLFSNVIWEDTTIDGSKRSIDYPDDPSLTEWKAYYWRMRVEVDSIRATDTLTYWQEEFTSTLIFFYTTATLFHIYEDPSISDLPSIQKAIVWAAAGDTIWVDTGTYYENLRFYKDSLLLTSRYLVNDQDTATINKTIIDGSKLTGGKNQGSVVYFSPEADSSSILRGFTIRGGTGTEAVIGGVKKIVGGGIFCGETSSPTIVHNVITDNQAKDDGGGIFINSAAPNILHNIITRNSTLKGSGGGIACHFSIKVGAPKSLSPSAQKGENKERLFSEKSGSGVEIKASPSPSESRLNSSEGEIKNSLNPKDVTEVSSPTAPGSTAKTAQNTPPVAVVDWYARKDTIIQRDKYLPGDTLFFHGTRSSDADEGDSITSFLWRYLGYYECWKDTSTTWRYFPNCSSDSVCFLAIEEESRFGMLRVVLRVRDTSTGPSSQGFSDTLTFNVQYAPHADPGDPFDVPPGDTAWLDGSGSCDINPDDVLTYYWTQNSGTVSVTIENANSDVAYFVPEDNTYLGTYEFQLKVTDSYGDEDSGTVQVIIDNPPIAVCQDSTYGDTLAGYLRNDIMTLNASLSYDPDPDDQVKYYIWNPVEWCFPTQGGIQCLSFSVPRDSTKAIQSFTFAFGGLLKFRLKVRDSYGVISQNHDSVFFSIQSPPVANAGADTVLRPVTFAHLFGTAIEVNPDQRQTLKYYWRQTYPISTLLDTVQYIKFFAAQSGIYKFELTVDDRFILSTPDQVVVVANQLPNAIVVNVPHAFEGNTVQLDASSSYDPDSATFQHPDSSDAGGLKFAWSVKSYPVDAEEPVIVNATQPVAHFIPYGTGTYKFQVLVNDTISKRQPPVPNVNMRELTVNVDSTYAYPVIQGNLISYNLSASKGGGIDCNQSSPDIISNILYKNQSKLSGGAISCRNFSTPQIKSNVFFSNISSDSTGGAIADLKAQLAPSATRGFKKKLAIQYNDFWDNRGGALYQASGDISNNIYTFPRLVDPDFGDFRFECSSPCFGAGDPLHPDIGSLIYFQPCSTVNRLGMVSLSLFQNPVATAVAHFILNTDVPLKAPPVAYVTIGDLAPSLVRFVPISSKTYQGSFVFTASGTAKISVFASSLLERDTLTTRDFSVAFIGAGKMGRLVNSDEKVEVVFPEGSVKENMYATCISVSEDSRYQFEDQLEMVAFGETYQLGPSISFDKDLIISFPLGHLDLKDKDKTLFSIYKYEDGKWSRLESFLDGNSVCTKIKSLGIYRLIYDPRGKHITGIPKTYQLLQNYPNPFNPETQIRYDLPVSAHVKLSIYNVLGQRVRILVDQIQDAGYKSVIWDGRDNGDREVASGIYFYKIEAENYQKTKKMVLLK